MTDLQDLLRRVEGAEGPDDALDADLFRLLDSTYSARRKIAKLQINNYPAYTASLDASLALAKRLGFYIRTEPRFHIDGERVDFISYALRPRWSDWSPDDAWFDRGEARHADQVLSALAALLRALQEQQP